MGMGKVFLDDCFLAGMVHDVGILIMHQNSPDQFNDVSLLMQCEQVDQVTAETSVYGFNHGLVGAYLLGIWGLRYDVVEAVAYHHAPGLVRNEEFCVALAYKVKRNLLVFLKASIIKDPEKARNWLR